MNKLTLLKLATHTLQARKCANEEKADATLATLRKDVVWTEIESNLRQAEIDYAMSDGKEKTAAEKLMTTLTAKRDAYLKSHGLTADDLKPHYFCAKCNDSGYVDGNACDCLDDEICKLIIAESNIMNRSFTFDNSTETDKENLGVYKSLKKICLGQSDKSNALIYGNTGSGKTYLLTACANLCADDGKSVLLLTAYTLNGLFLDAHMSDLASHQAIMDGLIDVDVLLIDDLGTENVYKNVTAEYFFSLINERMARKKQTFISTNLTLQDIRERYDERIFSRLVDQNSTFVHPLNGVDKRIKKA